jgi:hypothetical protein
MGIIFDECTLVSTELGVGFEAKLVWLSNSLT